MTLPSADLKLWYSKPAVDWESEALPLGNGRLGMMAFGGIETDRFSLNEITVWDAPEKPAFKDLSGPLKKARALLQEGKEGEAQDLVQGEIMAGEAIGRYQPLCDLVLKFKVKGGASGYRRELDLEKALHTVSYEAGGVKYSRRAFVSAADDVMAIEVKGRLDFELGLGREENFQREGGRFWGRAGKKGVKFEGALSRAVNGDAVLLLIAAATDYQPEDPMRPKPAGWEKAAAAKLKQLEGKSFDELLEAHLARHREYFSRVELDLGGGSAGLPTDERLAKVKAGEEDAGLEALYFQYGRYLLMGSSLGGPLPANLQGLWNKHLSPPWSADYHININLQMNYWPAEAAGLPEVMDPMFSYLEAMRPSAREVARAYGMPGMAAGHSNGAFFCNLPSGKTQWGMWVTGLAWCARHYMEHYRYGGDGKFLKERAWPFMKEAAEFLEAWLIEDPKTGKLLSGPAISPENQFFDAASRKLDVSMGPSMDQEIAWDLFDSIGEAAAALKIDDAFVKRIAAAKAKLAWPGVGSDGRLLEWATERGEPEPGHRHLSHLYAVHPGHQFQEDKTPVLWEAARKSLEFRLSHGGGHTGWSRAWIMNFWARFRQGGQAHANFQQLLSGSTLQNLFDTHPPFQIDGNFGAAAAVCEMLLQSQQGTLDLLPALPPAWQKGELRGLRARGGYTVGMKWDNGKLVEAKITASRDGECRLRSGYRLEKRNLKAGESWAFKP